MDVKKICDLIEERKDELFSLLSELVRINTENFGDYGNDRACAEYILKLCQDLGLESVMYSPMDLENFEQHPDYFPGRHLEDRFNVTARWKGAEDCDRLMLMGHLDTVEIGDPNNWDGDPLSGEIRNGNLYGRGSNDDKYALATALYIIRLLKDAGFEPKKNLLFNAYCDEEMGGSHGAMAAVMHDPCQTVVNMDGRVKQIWHCASGGQVVTYRYRIRGTADNAERAARAIPMILDKLAVFGQRRKAELEQNPYYAGTNVPGASMRYNEIRVGKNDMDKDMGVLRFTFYTDKTKEQIWEELDQLHNDLQKELDAYDIDSVGFEGNTRFFHYGVCDPNGEGIQSLVAAAKEATGADILVCGSCLSDLSVLLKYGAGEAFSFGNGRDFSEPGGAHQPNEFMICDSLVEFAKMIAAYVLRTVG